MRKNDEVCLSESGEMDEKRGEYGWSGGGGSAGRENDEVRLCVRGDMEEEKEYGWLDGSGSARKRNEGMYLYFFKVK